MESELLTVGLILMLAVGSSTESHSGVLLDWARDLNNGRDVLNPRASVQQIPDMGMGIVADMSMEEGEWVSRTSLSAVINIEHAFASEHFSIFADHIDYMSNTDLTAVFVAYERERGRDSDWAPYLASLPEHIPTTFFFEEKDIEQLQTSMTRTFVLKQQAAGRVAFGKINKELENFPNLFSNFTEEIFFWGISVWTSRAHLIRVLDRDGQWQSAFCLVPLADLFNMALNKAEMNVHCGTNKASTHFECYTTRAVAAGSQLLVEYATDPKMRHNGRLLMHYAFVSPSNPYDSVSVEIPSLDTSIGSYSTRKKLSSKLPLMSWDFFQLPWPNITDNPDVLKLVEVMRLAVGTVSEIKKAADLPRPFSEPLSSAKSERKAVRRFIEYLRNILGSYKTTSENDKELLERGDSQLSLNSRNAVLLRLEEKRILQENIAYLEGMLVAISGDGESKRSEL